MQRRRSFGWPLRFYCGVSAFAQGTRDRRRSRTDGADGKVLRNRPPRIQTTLSARKTSSISASGRNRELTRELPVRPDGKISIPLLSDVQAAG